MTLAGLIAAGAPSQEIVASLESLGVAFDLSTERVEISGVEALMVVVSHPEESVHRTFEDIRALVERAGVRAGHRGLLAPGRSRGSCPRQTSGGGDLPRGRGR